MNERSTFARQECLIFKGPCWCADELMSYNALQRLLREHAPDSLLPFMFRHGRAAAACELVFPPANGAAEDIRIHHADTR